MLSTTRHTTNGGAIRVSTSKAHGCYGKGTTKAWTLIPRGRKGSLYASRMPFCREGRARHKHGDNLRQALHLRRRKAVRVQRDDELLVRLGGGFGRHGAMSPDSSQVQAPSPLVCAVTTLTTTPHAPGPRSAR